MPAKRRQTPGETLRAALLADLPAGFELDARELELLARAGRLADEIELLEQAVDRDGATVAGSRGQVRVHPAVAEARAHRLALARLLGQLRLEPPEELTPGRRQAQKAAQTRWQRRRQAATLREAG